MKIETAIEILNNLSAEFVVSDMASWKTIDEDAVDAITLAIEALQYTRDMRKYYTPATCPSLPSETKD